MSFDVGFLREVVMRAHRTCLGLGLALVAEIAVSQCLLPGYATECLLVGNEATTAVDVAVESNRTFVDLATPATATGFVQTARFGWSDSPCPHAAMIKLFRQDGQILRVIAEWGPFDAAQAVNEVALEPEATVKQGDLFGISRVSECGGPKAGTQSPSEGYISFAEDTNELELSSGSIQRDRLIQGRVVGVAAESVRRVLPAAGSTPGAFGSFFRTGMQLSNTGGGEADTGRLVFRKAGSGGTPDDPSLPYSIAAFSTVAYSDILEAMGQTGLGTLELVVSSIVPPNSGGPSGEPQITARVYEDRGAQGTSGFTEDAIDPDCCGDRRVFFMRSIGYLVAPADPTKFRFNIGVRALFRAPTVKFRIVGHGSAVTRTYLPSSFEQQSAEALLGESLPPNALIEIFVEAGNAIVYGATVDNISNDPSIQFATASFFGP
jgi:hypothetical protein